MDCWVVTGHGVGLSALLWLLELLLDMSYSEKQPHGTIEMGAEPSLRLAVKVMDSYCFCPLQVSVGTSVTSADCLTSVAALSS